MSIATEHFLKIMYLPNLNYKLITVGSHFIEFIYVFKLVCQKACLYPSPTTKKDIFC